MLKATARYRLLNPIPAGTLKPYASPETTLDLPSRQSRPVAHFPPDDRGRGAASIRAPIAGTGVQKAAKTSYAGASTKEEESLSITLLVRGL